jgi:ATP-dependent Clp protease protease subunit
MSEKTAKRLNIDNITTFLEDGIDIDNRKVQIFQDIDQKLSAKVISGIQLMLAKNKENPIDIYINSFGGDIYSGFGLYDFISLLDVQITITVVGCAMSAASVVLMAGDVRKMTKNSRLMLHTTSGGVEGKSYEIITDGEEHKVLHNQMCELYGDRSKVTSKQWKKDLEYVDKFYSAKKALELGLIDEILEQNS